MTTTMSQRTLTLCILLLGFASACERARVAPPESTVADSGPVEPEERPLRADRPRDDGGARGGSKALQEVAEALETEATKQLDRPCDRAHATLVTLSKMASTTVPPRARFLEVCGDLPEQMQLCLSPAHQMAHRDECMAARDALDEEQMGRLRSVMSMGGRDLEPPSDEPPVKRGR